MDGTTMSVHSSNLQASIPVSPVALASNASAQAQQNGVLLASSKRNIKEVILTDIQIETWYPSPMYPGDLVGKQVERLYVCMWCFRYSTQLDKFVEHTQCCSLSTGEVVGRVIYEAGDIKICEVDGEEHKMFAQNLSLFAKLFLDTKSVFFDATTFMFYVLYFTDSSIPHSHPRVVGFFSKEKLSWDSNNLACICVFPPWQKRGFGQVLMGTSYMLSRYDGRLGGPEKPLSELGLKAYTQFWKASIARYAVRVATKKRITVDDISEATFILPEDIIATLKDMNIVERKADGKKAAFIDKSAIISWMSNNKIDMRGPVNEDAFMNSFEQSSNAIEG